MPAITDYFAAGAALLFSGRTGTPFSADGVREYTQTWQVVTKVKGIDENLVCVCPGLPLPYAPHPTDLAALNVRMSAANRYEDDWSHWTVTVNYSTRMPDGGAPPGAGLSGGVVGTGDQQSGTQNKPEAEPPDIEWDFESLTKAPPADTNGDPFVNSASVPYTPAPTFEFAHAVLLITRNEANFNRVTASSYAFAVNNDRFLGADPGCVQCMPPKAKMMFRGSISYWRVSYRLRFGRERADGTLEPWDPVEILDAGTSELVKTPGKVKNEPIPILHRGVAITHPVLLDGKGKKAVPGANGKIVPFYNKFYLRKQQSFANLLSRGVGGRL